MAVPVPSHVRDAIERVVAAAMDPSDRANGIRWVGRDALHVTLRFLGSTSEDRVGDAAAAVAAAALAARPFEIRVAGSGAFPGPSAPRVLWMGIDAGAAELAGLARALDGSLAARGWPSDRRPFRAHLTLARCEDPDAGRSAARALEGTCAGVRATWHADSLVLFESHLGRGPARYAVVADERLGG